MSKIIVLVGPCGSGKSTLAKKYAQEGYSYINQDSQGKEHLKFFEEDVAAGKNIIIDRMSFNKVQRERYLGPAKKAGYESEIIVLHESFQTCLDRCVNRVGHENIKDEATARKVLHFFFSKYERPEDDEADKVTRIWPKGYKEPALIIDIDGTTANINHRLKHVRNLAPGVKKNWKLFFQDIPNDTVNEWCKDIILKFCSSHPIIYCSGRPDDHRKVTKEWLEKNDIWFHHLYMRPRGDQRDDTVIKEIILDFEILTRFSPYFTIDDRSRVVDLWRSRGITTLQCSKGDF